ncbi:hypothetical protein [Fusibacter sp. 3D3]|uniref:hypothetical protein n=1 Tax=Fusibacter sp. 3D3 TaxID=1048380 RepID=UPI0008535366|nr:hypothetical protein [Fusibacter sp. 3D3]
MSFENLACIEDIEYHRDCKLKRSEISLIQNINSLEEEVVRWRYALIQYLPTKEADELRSDIFSNLTGGIDCDEAYQFYVEKMCGGHNPMDDEEHFNKTLRLRDGRDDTTITL